MHEFQIVMAAFRRRAPNLVQGNALLYRCRGDCVGGDPCLALASLQTWGSIIEPTPYACRKRPLSGLRTRSTSMRNACV